VVTELPITQEWESYLEMNVNRWRTQLGLPTRSLEDQKADLVEVDRGDGSRPAYLLDLRGTMLSTAPKSRPVVSSASQSAGSAERPFDLKYQTPDGWVDNGPSGMRLASFAIDGDEKVGVVTVIIAGGDRLSNVERWQAQLSPDAEPASNQAEAQKAIESALAVKSAKGIEGQLYSLYGPQGDEQPAMLAAILPSGKGESSVFVKLSGQAPIAEKNRDKLIAFISSLEW
jgi:hypothetical protein